MSYSADRNKMFKRAAGYVDRILQGERGFWWARQGGTCDPTRVKDECLVGKFSFHTYGASPVSCVAWRAVLRERRGRLQANSAKERSQ